MRKVREGIGEAAPRYYRKPKPLLPPHDRPWLEWLVVLGWATISFWALWLTLTSLPSHH